MKTLEMLVTAAEKRCTFTTCTVNNEH